MPIDQERALRLARFLRDAHGVHVTSKCGSAPIGGPRIASKRGFTLVEVMFALGVMLVLTLIFAACVPVARKAAIMNGQYSQAVSLCQHKIDQLRAIGYGRINYDDMDGLYVDVSPTTSPYSFTEVDEVASCLIQPTTSVEVVKNAADTKKTITVTITWKRLSTETARCRAKVVAEIYNVE